MEFKDRNILVVGGAGGMGSEICKILKEEGATVYSASRNPENSEADVKITLDVTEDFSEIPDLPDKLDGLVYLPGTINLKMFKHFKPDDFRKEFEVNVVGAFKTVKACESKLAGGSIVFMSTVAVKQGMRFHASTASAKGALEGFARSIAAEFADRKIRVNCIAPSLVDTPLAKNLLNNEKKQEAARGRHALKRYGQPSDTANLAVYLLSDKATWITGQTFGVDGGLSSVEGL